MNPEPTRKYEPAWTRLMRASRIGLSAIEAELKAAGLPPLSWYDALLELERAPANSLRPFELSAHLLLAQYNMSRLLARLEAGGLIVIEPCADDRRGRIIRITRAGRALRKRIWAVYGPAIEKTLGARLTSGEARQLAALLGKIAGP